MRMASGLLLCYARMDCVRGCQSHVAASDGDSTLRMVRKHYGQREVRFVVEDDQKVGRVARALEVCADLVVVGESESRWPLENGDARRVMWSRAGRLLGGLHEKECLVDGSC